MTHCVRLRRIQLSQALRFSASQEWEKGFCQRPDGHVSLGLVVTRARPVIPALTAAVAIDGPYADVLNENCVIRKTN